MDIGLCDLWDPNKGDRDIGSVVLLGLVVVVVVLAAALVVVVVVVVVTILLGDRSQMVYILVFVVVRWSKPLPHTSIHPLIKPPGSTRLCLS